VFSQDRVILAIARERDDARDDSDRLATFYFARPNEIELQEWRTPGKGNNGSEKVSARVSRFFVLVLQDDIEESPNERELSVRRIALFLASHDDDNFAPDICLTLAVSVVIRYRESTFF